MPYHRRLKDEPLIVGQILADQSESPKWGADDEDSKLPSGRTSDARQLIYQPVLGPFHERGVTISTGKKTICLCQIVPGLALPCTFYTIKSPPIPLHLYDFALHLFHNYQKPRSLTFMFPNWKMKRGTIHS